MSVLIFLAMIAVLSVATNFTLHFLLPKISRRRHVLLAMLLPTGLLSLLPIMGVIGSYTNIAGANAWLELGIPLLAITVMALLMALIIGLPIAIGMHSYLNKVR